MIFCTFVQYGLFVCTVQNKASIGRNIFINTHRSTINNKSIEITKSDLIDLWFG